VREPGLLEGFDLTPETADALILEARIAAGWIEPPEPSEEELAALDAEAADEAVQEPEEHA